MIIHVAGIDPGLIHTGVVSAAFNQQSKLIEVNTWVALGPDAPSVGEWLWREHPFLHADNIWIEKYRPRGHLSNNIEMVKAEAAFKQHTQGHLLLNTGVKKVVRRPLMELLGMWQFATPTNHDDLRSAARIMLYGMLKNETLNKVIADVVADHLNGRTWDVSV